MLGCANRRGKPWSRKKQSYSSAMLRPAQRPQNVCGRGARTAEGSGVPPYEKWLQLTLFNKSVHTGYVRIVDFYEQKTPLPEQCLLATFHRPEVVASFSITLFSKVTWNLSWLDLECPEDPVCSPSFQTRLWFNPGQGWGRAPCLEFLPAQTSGSDSG